MPERVWDAFLTEQDHAHLAMSAHRRIGFGRRPALLLVDLYRWGFGDRPEPLLEAIKTWPSSCGLAAWQAIPPIQILLKAARDASIPIVHMTGLEQHGMKGWTAWREPPRPEFTHANQGAASGMRALRHALTGTRAPILRSVA
jgi:maleamate amidohydrolase